MDRQRIIVTRCRRNALPPERHFTETLKPQVQIARWTTESVKARSDETDGYSRVAAKPTWGRRSAFLDRATVLRFGLAGRKHFLESR